MANPNDPATPIDAAYAEDEHEGRAPGSFGEPDERAVRDGGIDQGTDDTSELTEEQYRRQFDTNVWGLLAASQATAAQFGEAGGSIINISSIAARGDFPGAAIYAGTKGAVDTITNVLARERLARYRGLKSLRTSH